MSTWRQTLDVSDVFHDDDFTISEKARVIADRIPLVDWQGGAEYVSDLADELSEQTTAEGFDEVWRAIYDEADYYRVWVKTR